MERLQKYMSNCGIASRRKCEEIILAGRVTVNGNKITKIGCTVDPQKDKVYLDGKPIKKEKEKIYLIVNKPRGYVSTVSDPEGRKTVLDLVPQKKYRLYPIGRLDYASEGIIILTNDGDFAYKLSHPKFEIEKKYNVTVKGIFSQENSNIFRKGIQLEDGIAKADKCKILRYGADKTYLEITLNQGKNRQIRRMMEALGFEVIRLKRISIGTLEIERLKPGQTRPMSEDEIAQLLKK